jgi:hypothetical protein
VADIAFNSIFDAVSLQLHSAFPNAQIHGGRVQQGLKIGDFNVAFPDATHTGELGQRARREPFVMVRYYANDGDNTYAECADIADQLTQLLGDITTPEGDVLHGGAMRWEVADTVLHFSVTYRHFVFMPKDQADPMETLETQSDNYFN